MNVAYLAYMNQYYLCVQLIYRAKSQLLHELCTRQGQAYLFMGLRFTMAQANLHISNMFRGNSRFLICLGHNLEFGASSMRPITHKMRDCWQSSK